MTDRERHRGRTYGGRIVASLLAVLMVTSVFGAVGTVAAAPGVSVSHATSQTTVQPGETVTITATFEQTEANSPAMEPSLPDGWTITAASPGVAWSYFDQQGTFLGNLVLSDSDGRTETYTHSYTVEVPDDASPGEYTISSEGSVIDPPTGNQLVDTASTTVTVGAPGSQTTSASVAINADSTNIDASTYGSGSYEVTNTGDTNIRTLTLDLSETMLPDMVFDPYNTAGDDVGKEFTLDGGDVTVQNVEYTNFHNGQNNDAGYDTMIVTLSGFEPGEAMSFSVDNDPTSISTTDLGMQAAGPVSGLELTGGTVSVDSGSGPVEATVVGDGSDAGATATVMEDTDESTPSLSVDGVTLSDVGLSDRHSAATVSSADRTVTISGAPANAEVTLLRVEGELNLNNVPTGYDIEAYEANKAVQVEYYTVTTDSNGEATVDVTLTDSGTVEESGLNYFTAWVEEPDGDTGPISDYVILELAANAPPTAEAGGDQTVDEGETVGLDASGSSDSDGSIESYSWTQTGGPSVDLMGTDSQVPTFDAPDVSSDRTLTFELEVTDDDGATATDTVSVTVRDTGDAGPGPIGDFQNAPTDPDGDGLYEDVNGNGEVTLTDVQALFVNRESTVVQENEEAFDFNDNGEFNLVDVQRLFVTISESN
jgi:hypothetical protein